MTRKQRQILADYQEAIDRVYNRGFSPMGDREGSRAEAEAECRSRLTATGMSVSEQDDALYGPVGPEPWGADEYQQCL